jgi:hypothetical protein
MCRFNVGIKHHPTEAGDATPNGSRPHYNRHDGGYLSLAKVEGCPCEDGVARTAHATAEADTFFTIPACVYVGRKTVGGFLTSGEDGWHFTVYRSGRNAALIKPADPST